MYLYLYSILAYNSGNKHEVRRSHIKNGMVIAVFEFAFVFCVRVKKRTRGISLSKISTILSNECGKHNAKVYR